MAHANQAPPTPAEQVFLDAVLTPHRSLSPRAFRFMMLAIAGVGFGVGTAFFLIGAWPVLGFCGLEVLLIYVAFKLNYRSAQGHERLRLTEDALEVRHVDPDGSIRSFALEPGWLQVRIDDPPTDDSQLTLTSHGRTLIVGRFLTPAERLEVAQALRAALDRWRLPPGADPLPSTAR